MQMSDTGIRIKYGTPVDQGNQGNQGMRLCGVLEGTCEDGLLGRAVGGREGRRAPVLVHRTAAQRRQPMVVPVAPDSQAAHSGLRILRWVVWVHVWMCQFV